MMRKSRGDESGQTLVEYVIILTVAIAIVGIIGSGYRKSMYGLWSFYARKISAACPGCPADPSVRIR